MSESEKIIWVPKSETKVTVTNGDVYVSDEMLMTPRPIKKPQTGFGEKDA